MSRILLIPDLHCPFDHPGFLDFLRKTRDRFKTDTTVCLGDEMDFHALSRYTPDPNGLSPADEYNLGLEHLQRYYKAFPTVKVCTSNHTVRPYKAATEARIPQALMPSYKTMLKAPMGWEWADDWELDGVLMFHGEPYTGKDGALNAAKENGMNVAIGHIHSYAGVQFHHAKRRRMFGLNCGWGGDKERYAFHYAKHAKSRAVLGCGVLLDGEPHFIPMEKQ